MTDVSKKTDHLTINDLTRAIEDLEIRGADAGYIRRRLGSVRWEILMVLQALREEGGEKPQPDEAPHLIAQLLEDAQRVEQLEPNAGTRERIARARAYLEELPQ